MSEGQWGRKTHCKAKLLFYRKTADLLGNLTWLFIFIQVLHFERKFFKTEYGDSPVVLNQIAIFFSKV